MAATALSRVHSSSAGYGSVESPPTSPLLPARPRRDSSEYLFKFLVLAQVFMYLEAGAVPSLLQQFTLTFRLSPQEQGLLGAIVYISISLASPWCSTLFRRFDPRQLLGVSLVVNNLAVLGLACTPTTAWYSKSLLISLRGFVGLTQAFSCVYSPLWVHDYAPKAKRGTWMSYLQGAVPVGITLGYFAGSVTIWLASEGPEAAATSLYRAVTALSKAGLGINANTDLVDGADDVSMRLCHGIYCWRWPFLTQFALILLLSILIFFVPREHIRLRATRRRSIVIVDADKDEDTSVEQSMPTTNGDENVLISHARGSNMSDGYSFRSLESHELEETTSRWSNLWLLLQHKVYVFIVMGLSGLFFVVAGVQFWTTLYLETNTEDSMYEIHLSYLLVSGTGPIMGVFFGGWLIDQFGGYSASFQPAQELLFQQHLHGCARWPHRWRMRATICSDDDTSGLGSVGSCDAACTYRIGFRIVLLWSVWAFFCLTCGAIESGRNYSATITDHSNSNGKHQTTTASASHQPVFKSVV
ncbi:hypothetical protein PF005_g25475 [Phytophthora fragariae]|uniref:Major facilitator superfamily (MFS) profile domain-containing protein n=1 Tax=Phytophthora fragariae TaxID=53985 RepID=A0A6A3DRE6_9STRA|nr:hypothetical protein PF009_g26187 [Phytophthora fragariae]KAE8977623.1 hypothetical protein PF011_g23584 [Phytophthora fragariae]KAE9075868.1 hypothetical protein PF007_g24840 [Phytophthora fragariae]KAE9091967.1 hypothetical protein PF006_g24801 [Phytophthora fragariae]KAE9175260.1 hypothetical protein PF005_g25475 [Phytophthora fragariae]